jgi:hypothetical protein
MSNSIKGPDRMMESAITEGEKAMKDPLKYLMQKIASLNDKFVFYILLTFIIIIIILALLYYLNKKTYIYKKCQSLDKLYSEKNIKIQNINSSDPNSQYLLRDYYIKTAYNACSLGSYKNSFCSICVFKDLVRQGVRGFDFEIYSIDNQPVISTSVEYNNYYIKETYNYVPFSQVMEVITNSSYAPNPRDPIIFHLRIKSTNIPMYQNLADLFKRYDNFFLGPDFSYENGLKNLGETSLMELSGKIVIIVDKSNTTFMDCREFYEYVNMTSDSIFMRALRYYDVKNTPDMNELIDYNKRNMTIALPDKGADPPNPSSIVCREMGCQMTAMVYSNFDTNLAMDCGFYDKIGSAFELKPERLRYKEIYVDDPNPQNPANSYETRNVSSDYYSFKI